MLITGPFGRATAIIRRGLTLVPDAFVVILMAFMQRYIMCCCCVVLQKWYGVVLLDDNNMANVNAFDTVVLKDN